MVTNPDDFSKTHYLNVDLDIYSSSDLEPLVAAFGDKVIVLHVGRRKRTYQAHLELGRPVRNADSAILGFCELIRNLRGAQRALWNTAKIRDFNIGLQVELKPFAFELPLSADTVAAVSKVRARIVLTAYSPKTLLNPRESVEPLPET